MCGVAGLFDPAGAMGAAARRAVVARMAEALRHRGPDDHGLWSDPEAGCVLGHRRLAIIDLSPEGHQPMISPSGRYVIAYNGEIYNFRTLRRELEDAAQTFRGHSDTEVLLALVDRLGLAATLPRLAGMFAFALWDRAARTLHLVRDRLGKKPLYTGFAGRTLVFASELKALRAHPDFAPEVDRAALALLLRHGYVPAPHTIYRNAVKLPPATSLGLAATDLAGGRAADLVIAARPYWSARKVALAGLRAPLAGDEEEALLRLEAVLSEAVAERMVADVPLGALLSGGIDSSTVVALMQQQTTRPVKTFSIGFREAGYDEAAAAARVAAHLGTDHTELVVTPAAALATIPRLPTIWDEPFADPSQIPTLLVCELARREVTVALSGDGGDEVFGGYNRHVLAPGLWRRLASWPPALRRLAGAALTAPSPEAWDRLAAGAYRVLPQRLHQPTPGYRVHKLAALLTVADPDDLYRRLTSVSEAANLVEGLSAGDDPGGLGPGEGLGGGGEFADLTDRMMYQDTVGYLPDDILVKVDRASMAVSLEARAPLLDHRVVELAWRLPRALKVRGRTGKWLLRRLLHRHVPAALVARPKQGFAVPLGDWLRGPLRPWAEDLLDPAQLAADGFLAPRPVRALWELHQSGRRDLAAGLWPLLMFQAWRMHGAGGARPAEIVAAPPGDRVAEV